MKKTGRKIGIIAATVLIIFVVAIVLVHSFGGRALKYGIETVGSKTMNVEVTLEDVSFSIMGGWLKLTNLKVANPEGYEHEYLLELGSGEVDLSIKSLLSDTIIVESIKLDNVSLVIEQKELIHNNLQEVLESLPSPEEEKVEAESPGKKVHIDKLSITNMSVQAKLLPIPGRADTVELTLAPIEMTDLGQDNKMTPAILVAKILRAIAVGIAQKGQDLLPDDMLGAISTVLGKSGEMLMEGGKEVLEKTTDIGKSLIEGTKDVGEGVTEGIKGLFGPKKDK